MTTSKDVMLHVATYLRLPDTGLGLLGCSEITYGRVDALDDRHLPAIAIWDDGEPATEPYSDEPRMEHRELALRIGFKSKYTERQAKLDLSEFFEQLWDAGELIRTALMLDDTFGGLVQEVVHEGRGPVQMDTTGHVPIGQVVLEFTVHYPTPARTVMSPPQFAQLNVGNLETVSGAVTNPAKVPTTEFATTKQW